MCLRKVKVGQVPKFSLECLYYEQFPDVNFRHKRSVFSLKMKLMKIAWLNCKRSKMVFWLKFQWRENVYFQTFQQFSSFFSSFFILHFFLTMFTFACLFCALIKYLWAQTLNKYFHFFSGVWCWKNFSSLVVDLRSFLRTVTVFHQLNFHFYVSFCKVSQVTKYNFRFHSQIWFNFSFQSPLPVELWTHSNMFLPLFFKKLLPHVTQMYNVFKE